jgi:dihydrodipicolinate synthase/N-acetylneuraminate lyase
MRPGVYPAAVTPHMRDGLEADFGAMLELVDFLSRFGAQGVCVLDAAGEFFNIKYADRVRLVHLAVKRSRVPVIAGVSHSTLDGAVDLAAEAISSGVGGLLLMPPYFFRYDQAEIFEFYIQFSDQIGKSVPVLLYNLPEFTTPIELETVRTLLSTGRFAGIKDSGCDAEYFQSLLDMRAELGFSLFTGDDHMFRAARQHGATGIISSAAGVVPELFAALDAAIINGSVQKLELLECKLHELTEWIDRFPSPVAVKTAVSLRKIKTGPLAVPLSQEKNAMLEEFRRWFPPWLETLKHVI